MTATTTMPGAGVSHAWTRVQRALALAFLIAVFAVVAFTVGRASAHTGNGSTITPPAVSTPSATGTASVPCHVGRAC